MQAGCFFRLDNVGAIGQLYKIDILLTSPGLYVLLLDAHCFFLQYIICSVNFLAAFFVIMFGSTNLEDAYGSVVFLLQTAAKELIIWPMARVTEENKHELASQQELVARIKGGEREAFSELVGQYQKKIFIFAYGFFPNREDALEIVQETFMRVFEKIANYHQDYSLSGWIYRLTHNICIDYYRKYAKKNALENNFADVSERQLAVTDNCHEALELRQMSAAIDQAVENLSLKQKSVFVLKYKQGLGPA
jgi:RNA polymerase sigma-70 factor (ECF subfamily)